MPALGLGEDQLLNETSRIMVTSYYSVRSRFQRLGGWDWDRWLVGMALRFYSLEHPMWVQVLTSSFSFHAMVDLKADKPQTLV